MSSDDMTDLRDRLAALDPMAGRDVIPLPAKTKERVMTTTSEGSERRAVWLTMAASAAVVAGGITAALVFNGSDTAEEGSQTPPQAGKKTVLQLVQPPANPAVGMCIQTSPETLRNAKYAFEGDATSVEGGTVSFDVTHWYKGGDQAVVTLTNEGVGTDGASTVEDSTSFEQGKTYLVTADDTGVGPCSGSGEKGPELQAMFEEAFGQG